MVLNPAEVGAEVSLTPGKNGEQRFTLTLTGKVSLPHVCMRTLSGFCPACAWLGTAAASVYLCMFHWGRQHHAGLPWVFPARGASPASHSRSLHACERQGHVQVPRQEDDKLCGLLKHITGPDQTGCMSKLLVADTCTYCVQFTPFAEHEVYVANGLTSHALPDQASMDRSPHDPLSNGISRGLSPSIEE